VVDDGVTGSARESTPSSSRRSVVEVVTRGEPRRRWSDEERARILAEAMAPGAIASHVARRFGVSTGQFFLYVAQGNAAAACAGWRYARASHGGFRRGAVIGAEPKAIDAIADTSDWYDGNYATRRRNDQGGCGGG